MLRSSPVTFLSPGNMSHLLNRAKVYTLYFYEYLRYAEFRSALNAILYVVTRRCYSVEKRIKSRMGLFETRKGTLDFQYANYAYEIDLKHFIEQQEFDVFFDVGACLGEYCIWLGRQGCRCVAFEPVYDSFKMIRKNIQLNGLEDTVTVFNYGLGSKHSIEHFQLNRTNPGANRRITEGLPGSIKFEINALDDVYDTFGLNPETKILMKIDVEGMEVEMLKGAERFFRYFNDVTLIVEEKISGESKIINTLNSICPFEYGHVDNFNIFARKAVRQKAALS
jgi:FkbM family methyltransferase